MTDKGDLKDSTAGLPPSLNRRRLLKACAAAFATLSITGQAGAQEDSAQRFLTHIIAGQEAQALALLNASPSLANSTNARGMSAYALARIEQLSKLAPAILDHLEQLDIVETVLAERWEAAGAMVAKDADLMSRNHPVGGNPLYAAALAGQAELYRLRSLGAPSNGRSAGGSGYSPAHAAMRCRDRTAGWLAAIDILSNGGHVNEPQRDGDSILHAAVRSGDLRHVRLALRKGADASATNSAGVTAAGLARSQGWSEAAGLIERPERVARDHRASRFAYRADRTPFKLEPIEDIPAALQSRITGLSHFNPKAVATMLADEPRLIHALSTDAELAVEACGHTGHPGVLELHLSHGAPMSLPTAISYGDLAFARWLLEQDPALVHERGPHDFPVMWYPAIGDSVAAAELLLQHGAPIEQESGGDTALHWAALRNRPELIHFLLDAGADPTAVGWRQDPRGVTPYRLAMDKGREQAVAALQSRGVRA